MAGRKRFLLLFALAPAILLACAGQTPHPKPTGVILEIAASRALNPGPSARPSPLALRIYELKSPSGFKDADFMSLYGNDRAVLGADLTGKLDLIVRPGEKKTVRIDAPKGTQAVGVFAVLRDFEHARWKATAAIRPHETTVVRVTVGEGGLRLGSLLRKPLQKK